MGDMLELTPSNEYVVVSDRRLGIISRVGNFLTMEVWENYNEEGEYRRDKVKMNCGMYFELSDDAERRAAQIQAAKVVIDSVVGAEGRLEARKAPAERFVELGWLKHRFAEVVVK